MGGGKVRSSGDQVDCIRATVQGRHGRRDPVPWILNGAGDFGVFMYRPSTCSHGGFGWNSVWLEDSLVMGIAPRIHDNGVARVTLHSTMYIKLKVTEYLLSLDPPSSEASDTYNIVPM